MKPTARMVCDGCERIVPASGHYVVRLDVFAEASLAEMTSEDVEEHDHDATMARLLKEMEGMTSEELQDGVARRMHFRLCGACQRKLLADPLAKSRFA